MKERRDKRARIAWIVWFAVLVASAFVVPYGFIGHIASPYASFLFWTLFAAVAVISIVIFMRRWSDPS
jgi:uncharacterized membrane protein